jgi:hypothetical protein
MEGVQDFLMGGLPIEGWDSEAVLGVPPRAKGTMCPFNQQNPAHTGGERWEAMGDVVRQSLRSGVSQVCSSSV